jgi:hypothetical protein
MRHPIKKHTYDRYDTQWLGGRVSLMHINKAKPQSYRVFIYTRQPKRTLRVRGMRGCATKRYRRARDVGRGAFNVIL